MPTVAQFLIDRLSPLTKHVFGVPGEYVVKLVHHLSDGLDFCNTTDEQGAGFAADAYARVNGFGVCCATCCVGAFKLLNPIAAAYAEKSPVLILSGSPGVKERQGNAALRDFAQVDKSQHKIFRNVTCASAVLDDPSWAAHEIDRVIDAICYYKRPGYIEIPRDVVDRNVKYDVYSQGTPSTAPSDEGVLREALVRSLGLLRQSRTPVILAGEEIARFGLGDALVKFAEVNNIPVATTVLGKSVVSEAHPLCIGVYAGIMSRPEIRNIVEGSDCLLILGTEQVDGKAGQHLTVNTSRVELGYSTYEGVSFQVFAKKLFEHAGEPKSARCLPEPVISEFEPGLSEPVTVTRLFEKINSILDDDMCVIADIGDSLYGASDLVIRQPCRFLSPAYYPSMGYAVPAALGVQLALPKVRPIVIVGDGAFQMTGMELSTIVRRHLNPIVFILNNDGYATGRCLGCDGLYNNLHRWSYHNVTEVINGGLGFLVQTEDALQVAVTQALLNTKAPTVINVMVDRGDVTSTLRRVADNHAKRL